MSYNDQQEPGLPTNTTKKRQTASLLPQIYRTNSNRKFLQSTLDQLTQPGTVKKINGFIGRQYSKASTGSDIFLESTDADRQSYQLEPAAVIKDYLGNVKFYKDYIDHINHVKIFNGNVNNHARLNDEQVYSWNPHIDFDKFTNYQNYYWMPYGPKPINVYGNIGKIETTMPVFIVDDGDNFAYVFNKEVQTRNPEITLYRGQTYVFEVESEQHPLYIKTHRVIGKDKIYSDNVTNNGIQSGKITIEVGRNTPDVLYYVSENDENLSGIIKVVNVLESGYLDVENDILHKVSYKMNNGHYLSNGMKLKFHGTVTPEKYADGFWYVEGVGSSIKLISEFDIAVPSTFRQSKFDYDPFDDTAFDMAKSFPHTKDYIVINRASDDRNMWTRSNRWFHQDVITLSAELNNASADLNQDNRATRPIIEFEPNIKLFNFGHVSKKDVDLLDTNTKDVFSTIEGSLTHYVDGVKLSEGMRVLFVADTDSLVNGSIYKVEYITINVPGRQVSFTLDGVDQNSDTINFPEPHGIQRGTPVTYLNDGYPNIVGLEHRVIYYADFIDDYTIKLYTDSELTIPVDIISIGINSGTTEQTFELFTGRRRQIRLVKEDDAEPILHETIMVKDGTNHGGKLFWYNGDEWIEGPVKSTINQPPLFEVFDQNDYSFSNNEIYPDSNFTGTKLFSYKVGTGTVDTELGFPLSYRNINNIGDISFNFDLLSDIVQYTMDQKVVSKTISTGYLKRVKDLYTIEYINGWGKCVVKDIQGIIRVYKENNNTTIFPIDVFEEFPADDDLRIKVYKNGVKIPSSSFSVVNKKVILTNAALKNDIITLKIYSSKPKNHNGFYEIPISLQNNPLNDDIVEFTLGQVVEHVNGITENISTFEGVYPGSGNLRDISGAYQYGTRFVQHLCPLNFSLYHLGSKSANIVEAIVHAENDYGKFKRGFITIADRLGIHTETKDMVDIILAEMSKNKPVSSPYYLSDMFAYTGNIKNEYVVLDARTKIYPLSKTFSMDKLSNNAVLIYLNGELLLHDLQYTFYDDFFNILVDLNEGDVIEVYEYDSTDGSCCPPTPTKLGLYPKYEPKIYIDDTYLTPTKVIQGHDGSITVAFNDYRDDLILELEKRIFNNIKIKYDPSLFDINDYVPGYNRITDYKREEFDDIISSEFYQWTGYVNNDFTKNPTFDRFNAFTYNYRDNYSPDGNDIPAYWRGIFKWMYDTDRPHLCPWEMLGFYIQPEWWESVYGPAPYTSDNDILWTDLSQGIIREPGKTVIINKKYIRPILQVSVPVDDSGSLLDPIQAGVALGYINNSDDNHFVIGDYSPVESTWRKSSYYPFALIKTCLLMKPNDVIGKCFDRSRIYKNKAEQFVYSTNKRIRLADLVIPSTYTSSERIQTSGLINYLIEYINSEVQSRLTDYISDLKSLTNNIGSKLGGFSSKEKYRLLMDSKSPTNTSGNFVPEENYQIFLNTSSVTKKLVYSGVVITKSPEGFEVKGYSIDTPYFMVHPYMETGRTIRVGGVSESFIRWESDGYYVAGKIVEYNTRYYRVKTTHRAGEFFEDTYYVALQELPVYGGNEVILRKSWDDRITNVVNYGTLFTTIQDVADFLQGYGAYLKNQGFIFDEYLNDVQNVLDWNAAVKDFLFWTTQNWPNNSVLSLSPSAEKLKLNTPFNVINDINDGFYRYEIFDVSGKPIDPRSIKTTRDSSDFSLTVNDDTIGIYGATLYTVQKEHVLILDNRTIFNDVIYDLEPGYRQERIRVLGYISREWDGGFNIPGFIFDQANVYDWEQWKDYNFGDSIKYKEFYYSAKYFIPGTAEFNPDDWVKQADKPVARMLQNWDYKAEQFTDFYDLDTDNFDTEQQKMAQHLIGYQKRQYLENIIKDDVSQYKFYQGMIIEKGTKNSFSKLFDVLSAADKESVVFDEEWAVRTGEYGATHIFDEIELVLDETKFESNPQAIEFIEEWNLSYSYNDGEVVRYGELYYTANKDITANTAFSLDDWNEIHDHVYRYTKDTVYITPSDLNNQFIVNWSGNTKNKFLRTPGYVRYNDVDHSIDKLSDLLSEDVTLFYEHDLVWCAFNDTFNGLEYRYWDVYSFEKYIGVWDSSCDEDQVMRLYLNPASEIDISSGDLIGIKSDEYNKFIIAEIDDQLNHLVINDSIFVTNDTLSNVEIYVFKSVRYSSLPLYEAPYNNYNRIWVDNYNGGFAVFDNNDTEWSLLHSERKSVDSSIVKKCYLYNKETAELVQYVDVIDTVYGKIPGIADQEIKYKMYQDPAIYSKGTSSLHVAEEAQWNKNQIGQVWWDLTRAKFIVNTDSELSYRTNTWNQLYKSASIDIYEWVESAYLPSEWDNLADTEIGLASGISGTSKYGDSAYSILSRFDNITGTYYNTYYFWVKNRRIIPNVPFRKMDSYNIASMIGSPINTGYPCVSLTSTNSLVLANIEPLLSVTDVVLVLEYWNVEDTTGNYHTEWKLISENANTSIPDTIEQKWIDSLVGYDFLDKQLPDYSLKPKKRYGVENKPRQSMFVNRLEALKQVIERTNGILKNKLIVDDYDLTALLSYDTEPSTVSGKWDISIDIDSELKFIGTALLEQAELTPIISNGKITGVNIVNPGFGYVIPPTVEINGNGSGNNQAKIISHIDEDGKIISVDIDDTGEFYTESTTIYVRPFAVLVQSDTDNNDSWTIRSWTPISKTWDIIDKQEYDVKDYWNYIDWYDDGFNQFTGINHIVENTAELYISSHSIGDIVKVNNVGSGGWLLLQKYADLTTTDYTKMYNIIGRQNGSIQFSSALYEYDTTIFTGTVQNPDPYAAEVKDELRIILNAIKNDILVDELRQEYLKLFFASIRYILSEQIYTDWVFKSSFIKVTHNVGELQQKITYNSDNLESFEDYINEVKPYRTKIREYISSYDAIDNSGSNISDFDFPAIVTADGKYASIQPYVDNTGTIIVDDNYYTNIDPWNSWYDNVGFTIKSIELIDGGEGYTRAPIVRFIGGYGKDASATAFISHGKVNRIKLDNPGTGFLSAPIIVLDGGVSSSGRSARAMAIIESEVARSTQITMKYDRVGKDYWINDLLKHEQFIGSGNRLQFKLLFAPDLRTNASTVLVNDVELLKSDYTLTIKYDTKSGYTKYYGVLTLNFAPEADSVIDITYLKNVEYLTANDRINFYYNATTGNPGKELSQLMSGIDYGGVIVTGTGFKFSKGWDSVPWDSDEWDSFDPGFDNWSITVPYNTNKIELPYVPEVNELINIYINNIRIDELEFVSAHDNIIMNTFIGDGVKNYFDIPGDIPSDVYTIGQQYSNSLVVSQYADDNIIIESGKAIVYSNTVGVIDTFSKPNSVTLRYEFVYKIGSTFYQDEVVIFNNQTAQQLILNSSGIIIDVDVDSLSTTSMSVNYYNQTIHDVEFIFSRWDISTGNVYNSQQTSLNDPLFQISSDYVEIYESELVVIDEFDKDEFSSGCYYVQLVSGTKIQLCEVELVHNGVDVSLKAYNEIPTPNGLISDDIVAINPDTNDLWFIGEIEEGNVVLSVKTLYETVTITYSKVMISSLTTREIDITDIRRLATDGEFAIVPFQYQTVSTTPVKVDEINMDYYLHCDYQVQLIAAENTNLIDFNILLEPSQIVETIAPTATIILGRECGYFTAVENGNIFELYFTPYELNVQIIGMKRMLNRPGVISPSHELGLGNLYTFMFIKQTSDGSLIEQPYDSETGIALSEYDTQLFGGFFENSTAIGYRPEDLITDGDEFITPNTSYAPEEMLPGYVADTVSIKVYQLPTGGSPVILYNHYIPDGSTDTFSYGQLIPSDKHVMVTQRKVQSGVVKNIVVKSTEYTVDGSINSIVFNTPPALNSGGLSITSFGFNSNFLLDTDSIVLPKATDRIITRAPWLQGKVKSTVLVNGQPYQYELYRTDEYDQNPEATGIRFGAKLPKNTIVQYMIEQNDSGNTFIETSSVMDVKHIPYTGPGLYTLEDSVVLPNSVVIVDDILLNPGRMFYFSMNNSVQTFDIPEYAAASFQYNYNSLKVYVNNKLMRYIKDYTINVETNTITIVDYVEDGVVIISLDDELVNYKIENGTELTIIDNIDNPVPVYDNSGSQTIKVISFFDYGTTEVERSVDKITSETITMTNDADIGIFTGKVNGFFVLRKPVLSPDYVWVSKNGYLLSRDIDYNIDEDLIKITLTDDLVSTDIIQIVSFSNNVIRGSFGYMQFKDILNRVHYKRLNKAKSTRLAQDLLQLDTIIVVEDGDVLDIPRPNDNVPGIIEINGERIEYFIKNGNELSQLRRGTLGTSTPTVHKVTTNVLNFGLSETIPYNDTNTIESFVTRRKTNIIPVSYIPNRRCDVDNITNIMTTDDIVYYDSYNNSNSYNTLDVVKYNGKYYQAFTNVPSSSSYPDDTNNAYWYEFNFVNVSQFIKSYYNYVIVKNNGYIVSTDSSIYYNNTLYDSNTPVEVVLDDIFVYRNNRWEQVIFDVTDDIEVFVGGIRLKKEYYTSYMNKEYPYSPEGDIINEPDYKVNGSGYFIKLKTTVPKGIEVAVIRKTGKNWYDFDTEDLSNANNIISRFIRNTESTWPQYLVDKYLYIVSTDTNVSIETDGSGSDILEMD